MRADHGHHPVGDVMRLTLVFWEASRSIANASSAPQPASVTMPFRWLMASRRGDARKRRLDLGLSLLTPYGGQVHEEALESFDRACRVFDAVSHAEHRPDPLLPVDDAVVAAERLPVPEERVEHRCGSGPVVGVLVTQRYLGSSPALDSTTSDPTSGNDPFALRYR